jgi:uncharacterized protein YqgV (UPF0045/DUF77 family)
LDALENNFISLRKMQFEKKMQMKNSENCLSVIKTIKEKFNYLEIKRNYFISCRYEKEASIREKISKSYANFLQGIPFYAVEV